MSAAKQAWLASAAGRAGAELAMARFDSLAYAADASADASVLQADDLPITCPCLTNQLAHTLDVLDRELA